MFKAVGTAASSVVIVLILLSIGAFGLASVEWQPIFQIMRNVALAGLGEETQGLKIQGKAASPSLTCDYQTGICTWGE